MDRGVQPGQVGRLGYVARHRGDKAASLGAIAQLSCPTRFWRNATAVNYDLAPAWLPWNVRGALLTVQTALPLLNDGASVILNDSIRPDDGREAFGLYAASKAAIRSLART